MIWSFVYLALKRTISLHLLCFRSSDTKEGVGEESMFIPGPGSLSVLDAKGSSPIGKGPSPRKSPVKRAR